MGKKEPKQLAIVELPKKSKKQEEKEIDMALGDIVDDIVERNPIDKEQAIAESIRLLGKTEDIDTLSELDNPEIPSLCALHIMDETFDIPILTNLSDHFVKFRVSKTRKGRKGIEDILKSQLNEREGLLGSLKNRFETWTR